MMKRLSTLIVWMLVILASNYLTIKAEENDDRLQVGDYIEYGSYESSPIKWLVLETDEAHTKVWLVASEILDYMAFDGAESGSYGQGSTYADRYGSNQWVGSHIRQWLNSDRVFVTYEKGVPDTAAIFQYSDMDDVIYGRAYDDLPGFLYGFDEDEKQRILTTKRWQFKTYEEAGVASDSPLLFTLSTSSIEQAMEQNLGRYKMLLEEKVFLLSIDEYERSVLRKNLTLGLSGQSALSPGYQNAFWLRTPAANTQEQVAYVSDGQDVLISSAAYGNMGMLPSMVIDLTGINPDSGQGSMASPYHYTLTSDQSLNQNAQKYRGLIDEAIEAMDPDMSPGALSTWCDDVMVQVSMALAVENAASRDTYEMTADILGQLRKYFVEALGQKGQVILRNPRTVMILEGSGSESSWRIRQDLLTVLKGVDQLVWMVEDRALMGVEVDTISGLLGEKSFIDVELTEQSAGFLLAYRDDNGLEMDALKAPIRVYLVSETVNQSVIYQGAIVSLLKDSFGNWIHASSSGEYNYENRHDPFRDLLIYEEEEQEILGSLMIRGIIQGYEDHSFRGQNVITRNEYAQLMSNIFFSVDVVNGKGYLDLGSDHWAKKATDNLQASGVMIGYDDRFHGDDYVTLQEAITVISRLSAQGYQYDDGVLGDYADLSSLSYSSWAQQHVQRFQLLGVLEEVHRLDLSETASRLDVAKLLYGFLDGYQ